MCELPGVQAAVGVEEAWYAAEYKGRVIRWREYAVKVVDLGIHTQRFGVEVGWEIFRISSG